MDLAASPRVMEWIARNEKQRSYNTDVSSGAVPYTYGRSSSSRASTVVWVFVTNWPYLAATHDHDVDSSADLPI
jgi:hypothetical protein